MGELCSEVGAAKIECMPFTAIPHNTRLFLDFLFQFEKVKGFYAHQPHSQAVLEYARGLAGDGFPAERRARVADVLERQNRKWGATEATLASIERFRQGAVACISGQQVGVLGGPLYSVLKAASALQMAEEVTAQGVAAIPVFWLATEDHDLAEIASVTIPAGCELEKLTATEQSGSDAPVGPLYILFVSRRDTVAALVHREAERDVLPQGPHVALSDAILNERRNLVERGAGDPVLRDVHRPGLDRLPNRARKFKLNPFLGSAKVSSVDRAVVDGEKIRANAPFIEFSDKPPSLFGLGETLCAAALGADFPKFDLEVQPGLDDRFSQF